MVRKKSICCVALQLRRCGPPKCAPHSSVLRALHLELFTKPSFVGLFMSLSKVGENMKLDTDLYAYPGNRCRKTIATAM